MRPTARERAGRGSDVLPRIREPRCARRRRRSVRANPGDACAVATHGLMPSGVRLHDGPDARRDVAVRRLASPTTRSGGSSRRRARPPSSTARPRSTCGRAATSPAAGRRPRARRPARSSARRPRAARHVAGGLLGARASCCDAAGERLLVSRVRRRDPRPHHGASPSRGWPLPRLRGGSRPGPSGPWPRSPRSLRRSLHRPTLEAFSTRSSRGQALAARPRDRRRGYGCRAVQAGRSSS